MALRSGHFNRLPSNSKPPAFCPVLIYMALAKGWQPSVHRHHSHGSSPLPGIALCGPVRKLLAGRRRFDPEQCLVYCYMHQFNTVGCEMQHQARPAGRTTYSKTSLRLVDFDSLGLVKTIPVTDQPNLAGHADASPVLPRLWRP